MKVNYLYPELFTRKGNIIYVNHGTGFYEGYYKTKRIITPTAANILFSLMKYTKGVVWKSATTVKT